MNNRLLSDDILSVSANGLNHTQDTTSAPVKNRKRVYLAVDSANLYYTLKVDARLDYQALLTFARSLGVCVESAIYIPRNNGGEREKSLLVALKYMNYTRVVSRPYHLLPDGVKKKSALDMDLALNLHKAALLGQIDIAVLVSGDGDFVPLVEDLIDLGVKVYVIGPDQSTAWELIVAANRFLNASQVPGLIQAKDPADPCIEPVLAHAA